MKRLLTIWLLCLLTLTSYSQTLMPSEMSNQELFQAFKNTQIEQQKTYENMNLTYKSDLFYWTEEKRLFLEEKSLLKSDLEIYKTLTQDLQIVTDLLTSSNIDFLTTNLKETSMNMQKKIRGQRIMIGILATTTTLATSALVYQGVKNAFK